MTDSVTPRNGDSNVRRLVLVGAGLVGASTAATSAVSLYSLAVLCGIPAPLAAALPIALDAGAGVAALVWITERGELRTWGRGVAVAALVATLAGNGVQHAITSGLLAVTLPLVLLVGACIPAMLWAVVHLSALMARTPDDVSAVAARQAMGRLYEQLGTTTIPRRPTVKPRAVPVEVVVEPVKVPGQFDKALIDAIVKDEGVSRRTAYRRVKARREVA